MFERSGHLGGKALMRDATVLYYGKCRIQHFCILALRTKNQDVSDYSYLNKFKFQECPIISVQCVTPKSADNNSFI